MPTGRSSSRDADLAFRVARQAHQALAAGELGEDHAGTQPATDAAEGQLAVALHGGQHHGVLQTHTAHLPDPILPQHALPGLQPDRFRITTGSRGGGGSPHHGSFEGKSEVRPEGPSASPRAGGRSPGPLRHAAGPAGESRARNRPASWRRSWRFSSNCERSLTATRLPQRCPNRPFADAACPATACRSELPLWPATWAPCHSRRGAALASNSPPPDAGSFPAGGGLSANS
jgi:hypothetical protein